MKLWIKTQDKKRIMEIDNVSIKGNSLRFFSQQNPFGILLGKYKEPGKAQTILDTIFSRLNSAAGSDCVFEMPEDY
ncbi:MAG: hypothetical protein ABFR36_01405 [Acidobacteriota bacterium]